LCQQEEERRRIGYKAAASLRLTIHFIICRQYCERKLLFGACFVTHGIFMRAVDVPFGDRRLILITTFTLQPHLFFLSYNPRTQMAIFAHYMQHMQQ